MRLAYRRASGLCGAPLGRLPYMVNLFVQGQRHNRSPPGELGPGDALETAVCGQATGARSMWMISE